MEARPELLDARALVQKARYRYPHDALLKEEQIRIDNDINDQGGLREIAMEKKREYDRKTGWVVDSVTPTVEDGQTVAVGDSVATIEAMKMEAAINAPVAGTVSRVVLPGTTQLEGGDFEEGVRLANRVLAIRGQVLPTNPAASVRGPLVKMRTRTPRATASCRANSRVGGGTR